LSDLSILLDNEHVGINVISGKCRGITLRPEHELLSSFPLAVNSRDPQFVEKLEDIVGLYMSPPEHALVLCCDEKSQVQALDRTQPGLPLKKGRAATMTHDDKRNGTTTLFAALNVLDGQVIAQCQQRHRCILPWCLTFSLAALSVGR
jgi:hypothetical protein